MMASVFFVIALSVFLILFIFWPLFSASGVRQPGFHEMSRLLNEREAVFENLKDLELDHQLGKIDDADYEELRKNLVSTASRVLAEIEKQERENSILQSIESDLKQMESRKTSKRRKANA